MNYCTSADECHYFHECISNICVHKNLFPMHFVEILTIFLLILSSLISTVGGVGGGVFFFPIIIAIFRFDPKIAIAISITSVSFILTVRYLMSIRERHMRRDRPMINYDVAIIFCPSIIIGTIFGVIMNRFSPNWFLLTLVSISMGATFIETIKKAKKFRDEEKNSRKNENSKKNEKKLNEIEMKHMEEIFENIDLNSTQKITKEQFQYKDLETDIKYFEPKKSLTISFLKKSEESLRKILEDESKMIPLKKIYILLVNMLLLSLFVCLQGNKNTKSIIGIEYCGSTYWLFQFLYIPFGLIILYFSVKLLNEEYEEKINSGYLFLPSDICWDKKTSINSIFIGIFIGFSAAILGVGGAIISGPVLLKMGFHPQESSYTASFMATFTAIVSSIQYVIAGMVPWDYTLMLVLIGFLGLFIGMNFVMSYIKRANKSSLIIICLAICIGFSTFVLIESGIEKTIEDFHLGRILKLKTIC